MNVTSQKEMQDRTGWSKATCSQLVNGTQDYSPKVVNQAAVALHCEPWELLMPPERAMALRGFRQTAREVAKADAAGQLADVAQMPRDGTNG